MKNKVDGITLLQKIRDGKIKDNTKIYSSDFVSPYYFFNGTLGYYDSNNYFYELSLKDVIENLNYATYEIIEEVEKYRVSTQMASYDIERYPEAIDIINNDIRELTKAVNYLLKKDEQEVIKNEN